MDLGLKAVETGAEIADKVAEEADKVVGKAKDKWEKVRIPKRVIDLNRIGYLFYFCIL